MRFEKNKNLLENARRLRREMTKYERHFWYDFLRNLPVKFYKQRIIGNYIADFYCHRLRLIIELDGQHHYIDEATSENDVKREKSLEARGYTVVRFTNHQIENDFKTVCDTVERYIDKQLNEQDFDCKE